MAWETRSGHRYYYRGERVRGKVVKEYVGQGPDAELAAQQDLKKRQQKQAERAEIARIQEPLAPLAELMRELDQGVRMLSDASLLAAGFHQVHGTWRKRRVRKEKT